MKDTKKIIPVALASDNNYAMPMAVTMTSMLESANKNTFYDFYLLIPFDFSTENKEKINKLQKLYYCKINYIDMQSYFADSPNKLAHATNQSYYRLMLASIVPQYKKMLYLDVDIVVNADLAELYDIELGDNYYGGVCHPTYYFGNWNGHCKLLNIPDLHSYINAGVLSINLEKIRKDKLESILVNAVKNNYPAIDQDVINSVCYGKIKHVPFKFNVLIKAVEYLKDNKIAEIYNYDEYLDAFRNPAIVHFANPTKPWQNSNLLFADLWKKYFLLSPYAPTNQKASLNNKNPIVSVVMSSHNRQDYIEEAIESIRRQTFQDFEFIIVNDASDDNTQNILNYYEIIDSRIHIITNPTQMGISYSRNLAYDISKGKYIAVMDDDDIALSDRLEKEVAYLETHPNTVVVGSQIDVFTTGEEGNVKFWNKSWVEPINEDAMPIMMHLKNYICHSSTLIRKYFLEQTGIRYNESLSCTVDYDLWMQILLNGGKIRNLPDTLQRYRVHNKSITATQSSRKLQDDLVDEIRLKFLSRFFDADGYAKVFFFSAFKDLSDIKKLEVILELNKQKPLFDNNIINKCIAAQKGIPYPSFKENLIPIVFASDNNYAPYLAVLMKSIMENASKDYNYEFLVLETRISKLSKARIEGMFKDYKNLAIKFVNPSNIIKGIEFPTNSYYTEETYYRLCCQSIFSYYEKILYIDVDTIVLKDISELFNIDIDGYLLGATLNAGTVPHAHNNMPIRGVNWRDYLLNTLKIKDVDGYFQAGVLLINIPEITKFDLQGRALEKLKTIKPVLVDQDILNFVCEGKVKKISLQWDFLDSFRPEWKTEDRVNLLTSEDREDYIKASKEPYILHYAGEFLRAWEFPDVRYSDLWWHYAKMTPFYEEILFRNIQNRYIRNTQNSASEVEGKVIYVTKQKHHSKSTNKLRYWRYKLLSHITFGKTRKRYQAKKKYYKQELKLNC
ncbi:MAG: glycosyltransferase [Alphaproteobacteria bacterium]|nr:glycosyltransferase [Alphaproteobacteria bacterium]